MTPGRDVARGRSPTQVDVARLAGVSQALVSYVVNANPDVSVPAATRQRIQAAIDELGYLPDRAARSLRTRRTLALACIIPDITNPFYPAFQRGIQDIAGDQGYDVLTFNTDGDAGKEARCLSSVQQSRVDGVIAVLFHQSAVELHELIVRGIAVVRLESGRKTVGPWPLDNLYVDNLAAARSMVSHIIERGHRSIGLITGRRGPRPARVRGYLEALAAHGIAADERYMREGDFQELGAQRAMRELLALPVPPTAVFAVNDLMAIGALVAARDAGLRVPDDLAIAGFDDIPAAQFVSPPLTTVAQHPEQIGRRAAEMLLERLRHDAPAGGRCEELPFALVVRHST